jgi:hypothetical protein
LGYLGVLLVLLGLPGSLLAMSIEPYPGSLEVKSSQSSEVSIHRLITGEVKRVNGEVVPEYIDYVRGSKSTETLEIVTERRGDVIRTYFQNQIRSVGQILFECVGRDCGTSSYWAHTVFDESILYGPTEDQYYLLGKLNGDKGDFVIVYLAQRATGKRYSHMEVISDVGGEAIIDSRLIASALRLQHRFELSSDASQAEMIAIRNVINDAEWERLAIVAHDGLKTNETIDAAQARTKARAEAIKLTLGEMGADTRKLVAVGAGPIAPIDRSNRRRVELVFLR